MTQEWIMGRQMIQEAFRAGREIERILIAEGAGKNNIDSLIRNAQDQQVPMKRVPRAKLDQMAEGANHQGIMAQVAAYHYAEIDDLFRMAEKRKEQPFFLVLDQIEDPHNLGSILRTADAAGVHGVIIPKRRAVGLTSVVAKTSAGAVEYVPVVRVTNLNQTMEELKHKGLWFVGTDPGASDCYDQIDYTIPIALIIGNEGRGISRMMKEKCDYLVRLPMSGKIESLNASVAAGILMYEVYRGRSKND